MFQLQSTLQSWPGLLSLRLPATQPRCPAGSVSSWVQRIWRYAGIVQKALTPQWCITSQSNLSRLRKLHTLAESLLDSRTQRLLGWRQVMWAWSCWMSQLRMQETTSAMWAVARVMTVRTFSSLWQVSVVEVERKEKFLTSPLHRCIKVFFIFLLWPFT